MILVATNSDDPTADFVIGHLESHSIPFVRVDTDVLFTQHTHTTYIDNDTKGKDMSIISDLIDLSCVSAVWYRRPVDPLPFPTLVSEQAKQYAEDEGYYYVRNIWKMLESAVWVSKPRSISWAQVKLEQLKVARHMGLQIPKTLATSNPSDALSFYNECDGNIIVKPFTANTIDYGDRNLVSILTSRVSEEHLKHLDQVRSVVTFFQEEITKEYEVRVTVIGKDIYSAKIDSQADPNRSLDWRSTSPLEPVWEKCEIPDYLKQACFQMVQYYDLAYGAFDFAYTPDGEYVFFELNPNGQWAWQEIELGYPMTASLVRALGF